MPPISFPLEPRSVPVKIQHGKLIRNVGSTVENPPILDIRVELCESGS
jgi:hypothetical protein